MHENSKKLSSFRDHSKDMQVLRSIDIKSQTNESKSPQLEQLMIKLLMLSIEIDRKDSIIRELLMATSNNQNQLIIQELNIKCQKYQIQIKTLNETVLMLKDNISVIESAKNREVFTSITQFNDELETKAYNLEIKLRKVQDQKIEIQEQLKQHQLNQSMAQFQLIKAQQNQKGKVRQLQKQLANERGKIDIERKASMQKNIVIQDFKNRLMQLQNNERYIVQQYQEKLRVMKNQLFYNDNMKKSQITSNEERINANSQEILRLNEQIKYLKQSLEHQRQNLRNKQKQYNKQLNQSKMLEGRYFKLESQFKQINIKFQSKVQQLKHKEREIMEQEKLVKSSKSQLDEIRFVFANKNTELHVYTQEINRYKGEIAELYNAIDTQKIEIRKLKRKPVGQSTMCQSCRIKQTGSSSLISSQKSIKSINIGDIIEQTQNLIRSNRRIQSLINKVEPISQSSIQYYNQNMHG